MAKKKKIVHRFEVDYEGMGTCIEATIKLHGVPICVIGARTPDTNEDTQFLIKLIEQFYKSWDVK